MRNPWPQRFLRGTIFIFLLLPLTGLFESPPFSPPEEVIVFDDSESMRQRYPELTDAFRAGAVKDPDSPPVVAFREGPLPLGSDGGETEKLSDLSSALDFALGLFSAGADKRLLLVTDGLTDPEKTALSLDRLRQKEVSVYALRPGGGVPQRGVLHLSLPRQVFLWEPFVVRGRVASSQPGEFKALLRKDGVTVMEKKVTIGPTGFGDVDFLQEASLAGRTRYTMELEGQTVPGAGGEVEVGESPDVLYLAGDPGSAADLAGLLESSGISVDLMSAADLQVRELDFSRWDVIILDDIPFPALSESFQEDLRTAVSRHGRGLLVLGGRKGLGSVEFRDSLLEPMLPVSIGYSPPPPPSSIALVLAMDTSFSMYFRGRGGRPGRHSEEPRKIDVAKQSAEELVKTMRFEDSLGILGNSTDLIWARPLAVVDDQEETIGMIRDIEALGDGIYFYSIVRESYQALKEDRAPLRHVMVFCDSNDIDQYEVLGEGHSFDLIRRMAREGITLSILAIGSVADKDVPFLRTAAMIGRGDFYLVSNLVALPRYFVTEYKKLAERLFVEEDAGVVTADYSPILSGVADRLPLLAGINTVTQREGSLVPLQTTLGTPLLSTGTFGKGKTAVFASDNGHRWASRWLNWEGASSFWVRLIFSVVPERDDSALHSTVETDTEKEEILLHYRSRNMDLPPWNTLWLQLQGEGADPERRAAVRVGLQTYRSAFPEAAPGFYQASFASDEEGGDPVVEALFFLPPPPESLPLGEDWALVDTLVSGTGGRWIASPDQVSEDVFVLGFRKEALYILSLLIGVVLLLAETVIAQRTWR